MDCKCSEKPPTPCIRHGDQYCTCFQDYTKGCPGSAAALLLSVASLTKSSQMDAVHIK